VSTFAGMSAFGADGSKMIIEHDHLSIFDRSEGFCGLQSCRSPKMLNSPGVMVPVSALGIFQHRKTVA